MNNIQVIYSDVSTLKKNQNNAKIHNQSQIDQIKKSITDFGFNDPVAVDENYEIIEGHGRVEAAQQLGMNEIPIIVLTGLSQQQRKAYALIHNKLTMDTGFDYDTLKAELETIEDIDMESFSFDTDNDTFFDDIKEQKKSDEKAQTQSEKITVVANEIDANKLRVFLNDNKIKYKEKKIAG